MPMQSLQLPPGNGSRHGKLLDACLQRIQLSEQRMHDRYEEWRRMERNYLAYRENSERDQKNARKNAQGDDSFESITVSFSYTLMMTAHAYYVNVFLNRPTIFQMDALNGEGAIKTQVVESLLQYQVRAGKMLPKLMVWLLDVSRYGIGIIYDYWTEEYKTKAELRREAIVEDGVDTGKSRVVLNRRRVPGYKGNKLMNVLPFDYLPDPRVPIIRAQEGEFQGRRFNLQWNDYLKRYETGEYINKEHVQGLKGIGQGNDEGVRDSLISDTDDEDSITRTTTTPKGSTVGGLQAVELIVDLVPKEWDLGDEELPEKWVFTVVNKKVLIGARPLGRLDDMFPFHVLEQEIDGYFHNSRGLLEINEDYNNILTWLFNSHMYNKEQSIYNQFVADPSRVVMKDLTRKSPGKVIRLKPTAYNTDVRQAVSQLPVNDVTQSNYADTQFVEQMMQRTVGINDDVAGTASGSSRRSATEFRGTTQFSADRLADSSKYFSVTGWNSLARSLVSTCQDYYTEEMTVKIAGDNIPTIQDQQGIRINEEAFVFDPEEIAGEYDFSPVDGQEPIDRGLQTQLYLSLITQAINIPGFAEQYRLPDLFSYLMKLSGLKGMDKFKFNTLTDEQMLLLLQQQRGAQNGTTGQPGQAAGGIPGGAAPVAESNQTSGIQAPDANGGGAPTAGLI